MLSVHEDGRFLMRVIMLVLVVLAVIGLYAATIGWDGAVSSTPLTTMSEVNVFPEADNLALGQSNKELPPQPEELAVAPAGERPAVINIGELMDPDDPVIWPQTDKNEVISIGEPMDPDDPINMA